MMEYIPAVRAPQPSLRGDQSTKATGDASIPPTAVKSRMAATSGAKRYGAPASGRRAQCLSAAKTVKTILRYRVIYLMLAPAVLTYIVFSYFPMYGITIAFKDYWLSKGIIGSPWIGLYNFKVILGLDKFWQVFWNTIVINALKLAFVFPVPIALAILMNEVRSQGFKRTVQTVVYLPHFISWVVISGIVLSLLSFDNGLVNNIIKSLGGQKIPFMIRSPYFRPTLIITEIWKEAGWGTIIYFAVLCTVPQELYEAAVIDGAGRFARIAHVTLPAMLAIVSTMLILAVGSMTVGNFDQVLNLYNPMVYDVGDIIDTYIYRVGLGEGKYGMGTAVGLLQNSINLVLLLGANRLAKRYGGSSLY